MSTFSSRKTGQKVLSSDFLVSKSFLKILGNTMKIEHKIDNMSNYEIDFTYLVVN